MGAVVADLLVGLSRTQHGGDSFSCLHGLLPRDGVSFLVADTGTQPPAEVLLRGLTATVNAVNTFKLMGLGAEAGRGDGDVEFSSPWALLRCTLREEIVFAPCKGTGGAISSGRAAIAASNASTALPSAEGASPSAAPVVDLAPTTALTTACNPGISSQTAPAQQQQKEAQSTASSTPWLARLGWSTAKTDKQQQQQQQQHTAAANSAPEMEKEATGGTGGIAVVSLLRWLDVGVVL